MKISVIIPFHAYPHYLVDCLNSLQEQNIAFLETIIVSTYEDEKLLSLLAPYTEALNIRLFISHPKANVAVNRNVGLENATGDYVYFIDCDDYIVDKALAKLVDCAQKQHSDLVAGVRRISWFKKNVYEGMSEERNLEVSIQDKSSDRDSLILDEEYGDSKEEQQRKAIDVLFRARRGLNNISALHILIKRSIITEYAIRFMEQYSYYADLSFMAEVLKQTNSFILERNAIYIKRKHNDPINAPALSQIIDPENRFYEFITSYYYTCSLVDEKSSIRSSIERKMVSYYCVYFAKKIRRSEDESWRGERFEMMSLVLKRIQPELLASLKGYRKRLVQATIDGDIEKAKKIITRNLAKKKMKKTLKNKNEFNKYLYRHQYKNNPVEENWIVFESFRGQSYSDSPKYIYEYLAKHYPGKYQFIWVLNDTKYKLPYDGIVIKRFSRKYAYYLAKSKYFVVNVRQPLWYRKREEQILLQTWHGTPLKRLVFDQEEVTAASPTYKKQFFRQKQEWDYLIAANQFSSEIFKSCFMYDGNMLEVGYPRNDIMYIKDKEERTKQIKQQLGIPLDKKTILYAPTWRDDEYYGKGQYQFQLQLDLTKLKEKLGDTYVILLRTHYYIADSIDTTGIEDFAYNVSSYNDIGEIYLISDICITDYSSVFFDYANLQRPILFYTYDMEKYRDVLRGFYIDMEKELPGPLLYTNEEVIEAIENIEQVQEEYKEKYQDFYQRFCSLEDGNASKRTVEVVFK